jgi:hypothetical protein
VGIAAALPSSRVRQSHTKRRLPASDLRGADRDMPADPGGSIAGEVRRGHLVWPCLPFFDRDRFQYLSGGHRRQQGTTTEPRQALSRLATADAPSGGRIYRLRRPL